MEGNAVLRRASETRQQRPRVPRKVVGTLITYLLYALLALVILLPLAWVLLGSFKNPSEIFAYPTTFFPRDFTWSNYADVIRRTSLPTYLGNTAIVTLFTMFFTLGLGMLAAYGFSRWDFRFKNVVLVTLLILQLMPSTVNIIPYYLTMDALGLLNTRVALIIIYTATNIPFTIWIMKGFFDTLPRSLPGLSAAGFLVFLSSWSEFLVPLVIARSRDVAVMSVGLFSFFGSDTTAYHYAFSASIMSTLPLLIAYLFAQEYLVSGLASGAEK